MEVEDRIAITRLAGEHFRRAREDFIYSLMIYAFL